ncbi:MAG TPA: hypothetical protein V6C78_18950 [Crinalium sp.]
MPLTTAPTVKPVAAPAKTVARSKQSNVMQVVPTKATSKPQAKALLILQDKLRLVFPGLLPSLHLCNFSILSFDD